MIIMVDIFEILRFQEGEEEGKELVLVYEFLRVISKEKIPRIFFLVSTEEFFIVYFLLRPV